MQSAAPAPAKPVALERTRISRPVYPVHRAPVYAPRRESPVRQLITVAPTPEVHQAANQFSSDFLIDAKNLADFSVPADCIIT